MAFTAVASVMAGTATTAVVFAAVAEVGLALTVAGAITGDQELMKIGGTIGLIGGVGGLVSGAMSGAAAAGAAGEAGADVALSSEAWDLARAADQEALSGITGVAEGASTVAQGVEAGSAITGEVAKTGVDISQEVGSSMAAPVDVATTGSGSAAMDAQLGVDGGATVGAPAGAAAPTGVTAPTGPGDVTALDTPGGSTAVTGQAANSDSFFSGIKTAWNGLDKTSKSELIKGALSIPGGIQKSANDDRAFQQRQDQFNYEAGRNANIGQQTAYRSITGGLINSRKA